MVFSKRSIVMVINETANCHFILPSKICQRRFETRAANVWILVKSAKSVWTHSEIISEP